MTQKEKILAILRRDGPLDRRTLADRTQECSVRWRRHTIMATISRMLAAGGPLVCREGLICLAAETVTLCRSDPAAEARRTTEDLLDHARRLRSLEERVCTLSQRLVPLERTCLPLLERLRGMVPQEWRLRVSGALDALAGRE